MVAPGFLQSPEVRRWLNGVEPAWMMLDCFHPRWFDEAPLCLAPVSRYGSWSPSSRGACSRRQITRLSENIPRHLALDAAGPSRLWHDGFPAPPGLLRQSAPGRHLHGPRPLRSTTLTCRKASPDPSASCTKPNPLSGLYHLTTAWIDGPEGASNLWALDPDTAPKLRRGVSKLSSSKPRRRLGRKSLSAAHVILWRRMECSPI
jgi:hypothetical protein